MKHLKKFNEVNSELELFSLPKDISELFNELKPQLQDKLIDFDSFPKEFSFQHMGTAKKEIRCWFIKSKTEDKNKEFSIGDIKDELLQLISVLKLKNFLISDAKYTFNLPNTNEIGQEYPNSESLIEELPDEKQITYFTITFRPEK